MKKRILLAAVLMMVLIMGCMRGGGWYKPGMTQEGFSSDRDQCLRSSARSDQFSGPKIDLKDPKDGKIKTIDLTQFMDCMNSRGYRWEKNVDPKTGKLKE